MPEPAKLRILSRTEQPCTSNHCVFQVEQEPEALYCAYAIEGGCIVVKKGTNDVTTTHGASAGPWAPAAAPHAAPAGTSSSSSTSGGSSSLLQDTVLLLEAPTDLEGDPITCVMWGGGDLCTLAAASQNTVCVFSLQPFFQEQHQAATAAGAAATGGAGYSQEQQQKQQQDGSANVSGAHATTGGLHSLTSSSSSSVSGGVIRLPSSSYVCVGVEHSPAPILCMEFTQDGLGLLYSNAAGHINMLQVVTSVTRTGTSGVTPFSVPSAAAATLQQLWQARADHPHHLVAAGAHALGPCASLPLDQPQRVMIWWPSQNTRANRYTVGAEVIRHPVRVTGLSWSPPLHDSGGFAGALGSICTPGGTPQAGAGGPTPSSTSSPSAAAKADGSSGSSQHVPCHPALLTVGVDGVIRIWVEVVLADLHTGLLPPPALSSSSSAAAAGGGGGGVGSPGGAANRSPLGPSGKQQQLGGPGSSANSPSTPGGHAPVPQTLTQFCLTLVIEPPGCGVTPGVWPGMSATWARPMAAAVVAAAAAAGGGTSTRTTGAGSSSTPAAPTAAAAAGGGWGVPGSPPTLPPAAGAGGFGPGTPGGTSSGDRGESRVLWVVGSYMAPGPDPAAWIQGSPAPSPLPALPLAASPSTAAAAASSGGGVGSPRAGAVGRFPPPAVYQHPQQQQQQQVGAGGRMSPVTGPGPPPSPGAVVGGHPLPPLWQQQQMQPGQQQQQIQQQHQYHHQQQQQQQQGGPPYQDHVFVWAVDGLTGVVLSGMAQNAIMASKLSTPRALLWGKASHGAASAWRHPGHLLHTGGGPAGSPTAPGSPGAAAGAAAAGARGSSAVAALQVWVWSGLPRPLPLLCAAQHFHQPTARVSELRTFQVLPLTSQLEGGLPTSAVAVAPQHNVAVEEGVPQWAAVAVHPVLTVALTISTGGELAFWTVAPVRPVPLAPGLTVAGLTGSTGGSGTASTAGGSSFSSPFQMGGAAAAAAAAAAAPPSAAAAAAAAPPSAAAAAGAGADSQQLPRSWQAVQAACWLSGAWSNEAVATTSSGRRLPVLQLATAGAGCLEVCSVTLQYRGSSSAARSSTSNGKGPGWQVVAVQVLLQVNLPEQVTRVRHLAELGAAAAAAAADPGQPLGDLGLTQQQQSVTSLLAVAAGHLESPKSAAVAAAHMGVDPGLGSLTLTGSDMWLTWQLAVEHDASASYSHVIPSSSSSTGGTVVHLPALTVRVQGHSMAAAVVPESVAVSLHTSGTSSGGSSRAGSVQGTPSGSPSVPPLAPAVNLGQPQSHQQQDGGGDTGEQAVPVSVAAWHVPSPASPFFMTGDTSGHIYIWCALSPLGDGGQPLTAGQSLTEGGHLGVVDAAEEAAALAAGSSGHTAAAGDTVNPSNSSSSSGAAVALVQASGCAMLGAQLGGVVVAVALCPSAGFAAAATTCGQMEVEDAVFIWSAGSSATLAAWQSRSTHGQSQPPPVFDLDCLLPLEDTAASLAWLDCGGLPPLLAVGYASGVVEVYCRDHMGQWSTLATYSSALPITALTTTPQGLPLALASSQLTLFTNLVDPGVDQGLTKGGRRPAQLQAAQEEGCDSGQHGLLTEAEVAGSTSGSVALYHPDNLELLLTKGRLAAAVQVLRQLLTVLKAASATLEDAAAAAAAAAAGGQENAGKQPSMGQPPQVELTVDQLLQDTLLTSSGVVMCQQFRQGLTGGGGLTTAAAAAAAAAAVAATPAAAGPAAAAPAAPAAGSGLFRRGGLAPAAPDVAAPATPEPPAMLKRLPVAAPTTVSSGSSALDTGMLDMSAFGDFGGGFGGAPDATEEEAPPSSSTSSRQQEEVKPAAAAKPPAPAASNVLETGMLDMSAFGDFGGGWGASEEEPAAAPPPPEEVTKQQQQHSSVSTSSLQAAPAATTTTSSSSSRTTPAAALETGMLDMSAFGMGDMGHYAAEPEPEPGAAAGGTSSSSRPFGGGGGGSSGGVLAEQQGGATQQQQQQQQQLAVDVGTGGVASGSGSGGQEEGGSAPPLDLQQLADAWGVFPKCPPAPASGAATAAAAGGGAGGLQASSSFNFSSSSSSSFSLKPFTSSSSSSSSPAAAGASAQGGATAPLQQQQPPLLKEEELTQLHQLLQLPLPLSPAEEAAAAGTSSGGAGGGNRQDAAYFSRLLDAAAMAGGSKQRVDQSNEVNGGAAEGNPALLQLLGLDLDQVKRLVDLAGALSERTFAGQTGGSSAASLTKLLRSTAANPYSTGSAGPTGLLLQLDPPARLLVANVQLAVSRLRRQQQQQEAAASGGSKSERDERFAAAVRRLFQPVSVSRSAASALGRGAALLAHYPEAPAKGGSSFLATQGSLPSSGLNSNLNSNLGGGGARGRLLRGLLGEASSSSSSAARGPGRAGSASSGSVGRGGLRSSMSVASVLSFSSLRGLEGAGGEAGGGSSSGLAAKMGSRSWAEFMGLLPGVTPLWCLWAAASVTQGVLVDALLPLCPDPSTLAAAAAAPGATTSSSSATTGLLAPTTASGRPPSGPSSGSTGQTLTWSKLRALGAGLWLTDPGALRSTGEALARAQYAASKDPHDCALLYIALGKKQLVQGLFKSAGNKKVSDFLARDFTTPEARAAAAKNAFALLGQHRHALAAAFFLLAGAAWDGVGVLAREAGDPQLALLVARLVDTGGGGGGAGGAAGGGVLGGGGGGVVTPSGERLQERLVDEELLLLAEADSDPAAVALLHWVKGARGQAVATLLQTPQLAVQPAAVQSTLTSSTGAGEQQQGGSKAAEGGYSSRQAHGLVKQPALLDWVLTVGLPQLAGQPVPALLLPAVQSLAIQVARTAEVAGLPLAAAEAASVADAVLGDTVSSSTGMTGQYSRSAEVSQEAAAALRSTLDLMWRARLAAACLALLAAPLGQGPLEVTQGTAGLPAVEGSTAAAAAAAAAGGGGGGGGVMADGGQAQQQQVSPTSATQAAAAADAGQAPPSSDPHQQQQQQWAPPDPSAGFAEWEQYVERQLSQLPALQLLGADCAAVAACLQRHYRAFVPVTQLAAASLGDWSMFDQGQAQLSLDLATAGSLVGRGAATPDAALQICLSRSSSALEGLVSPRGAPSSSKRASEAGAVNPGQRGGQTQQPESNAARRASSGGLSRLSAHLQQLRVHRRSSNAGPSSTAASFTSSQHPFQHQQPQGEQQQGLLGASWDLVVAEGDRCKAVAVCSGSQYALVGTGRHRPLVYVTHKSGMGAASVAAPPDEVPPPSATAAAAAAQNSLLSGLMQQMLDHVRWPPDPWVIGEYPTRRSHSFGAAAMAQVSCCALAAHPLRPLYVSGSASGHIYMWCYGDAHSRAAYIPVTAQVSRRAQVYEGVTAPAWGAPAALRFSRSGARFGGLGEGGAAGLWRADFISAADGLGHAEWVAHVAGRGGVDLDFLGDTGSQLLVAGHSDRGWGVALWDTLAPPTSACAGEARLPRPRAAPTCLAFLPATAAGPGPGALLLVGDDQGYLNALDVRMWGERGWVWQERVHGGGVAAVTLWDVRNSNSSSSGTGGIAGLAGTAAGAAAAGTPSSSSTGAATPGSTASAAVQAAVPSAPMRLSDVVVSGGRDGSIAVVNVHSGSIVQLIERAHWTEKRGLLGGRSARVTPGTQWDQPTRRQRPAAAVAAGVTGVAACAEGVVSCGADGAVRLHPFAHLGY